MVDVWQQHGIHRKIGEAAVMSLIPYHPREGREIVLYVSRSRNAPAPPRGMSRTRC